MDRNYPAPNFSDPLVPGGQTWPYERTGSGVKSSLSYGVAHPETDLLHRPAYAASHQLPGYTTTHHPTGLSSLFDATMQHSGSGASETSVMNFLSAIESRTPQAGPAAASLLPQFRAPSWQTGMHSSTPTELFVTGALQASGTFPPSALAAYQHPSSFSSRSFTGAQSLTLQDAPFSPTTNGLISPHDPLLQIKSSQAAVPTPLTFDRIGSTVLSTSIPPSSTYRSAQESAPHHLQPQFSLLPSTLGPAQQASQAYGTSVFSSSTASIERALQRECSVIKHHQRPSSSHSVQVQLPSSHHSLQGYLTSGSGVDFQETSRHTGLACSPLGDQSQVSNGGTRQKNSAVTVEQSQSYSSTVQSPDYSSKVKNCSSRSAQRSTKTAKSQSATATVQTQSYSTPTQKQNSVIASQSQVYSSGQGSSLMSISQSQNYVSTQSQNMSAISHSEVYSSSQPEKLATLSKSPASYSGQPQNLTPVSRALSYSSDQSQVLPSVSHTDNYSGQPQNLSSISQTQSYPSGHSQGLSVVSQSQSSYSAQSQGLSTVSLSQSYASGQSLTLTSHTQSLPFSSSSRAQNLSATSPTQNFMSMHSSPTSQSQSVPSPQSQKFLSVHSPTFTSSSHSQTMQNTQSSTDRKQSYVKRKSDSDLFVPSKEDDEGFPIQDLLQQQSSLDASTPGLTESGIGEESAVYAVSKADDRYLSQSVIRSNSRLEDQVVGLALQESKTDKRKHEHVKQFNVTRSIEAMVTHHGQPVVSNNNMNTHDMEKVANPSQSSHIIMGAEELKQHHSLLHKTQETRPQAHQAQVINTPQHLQTHSVRQTPRLQLPGAQVLLDSSCEMPLALIQQSVAQQPQLLQSGLGQSQVSPQSQQIQAQSQASHQQSQFLQLERHIAQASAPQSQQRLLQQNSEAMKLDGTESSKPLQLTTKDHFDPSNRQDSKSQFVGLSSVCFSESMLLGVERNLFSGVEDVFSANEECGVSPQEFAKSACNESSIQSVERADGSKSTYQTVAVRHVSPNFHASQALLQEQQNIHNLTLSNSQINLDLEAVPLDSSAQSKTSSLEQQTLGTSDQHVQPGLPAPNLNSIQDANDQGIEGLKQLSANPESEEEDNDDIPDDGAINNTKDPDFIPSGRSNTDESAVSDIDYSLGDEITPGSGNKRKLKRPVKPKLKLGVQADGWSHSLPEEEGNLDLSLDGNQKKRRAKVRSKTLDDEICSQKPVKRSGQGKRLNSKDANSPHTSIDSYYESYHQQERINQKIREVEEKQPEVKSGFIASFLDFLKSGPKQQFPAPSVRMAHRNRRPSANTIHTSLLPPVPTHQPVPTALISTESGSTSPCKRLDDDLKKNLETLPAFSSDEEDSVGKNQDLQKSISSALSVLDDPSNKKEKWIKTESTTNGEKDSNSSVSAVIQQEKVANPSPLKEDVQEPTEALESPEQNEQDDLNPSERAAKQELLAVEGSTDEDDIESGGEGMYRERDEFVVKIEDIKALKVALNTGREPPAIWKVQKALLQKFMPEVKDGRRQFSATNSYLGYFGDAKTKYKRVYVKFIENVNKKDYVRVCSKKPQNRPMQTLRHSQSRMGSSNKVSVSNSAASKGSAAKSKARPVKQAKQVKVKAEPPPKKRKKWLKEEYSFHSDSSLETQSDDEERPPTTPYVVRFLNTRTMKETFKNYVELLVSTALDPDMIEASEQSNDEMYLPHMRKIDSMLNENKKRIISKFPLEPVLKTALENFPELTAGASGAKSSNPNVSKIKMSGKSYNKKTLQSLKQNAKGQKEFTVDQEKLQCCTLYHTLHHYKYHTYLICKKEAASILKQNKDLGQVETIQQCMENEKWVEDLFEKFGDLLTQAQQKCS
ncbi:glutamine and serine-rich protein 1 [Heterodontus francisci]|uniref:glutamine and serine-rich protein 1 n=1 Tax=Heterodontus francisci TaxID=7792 RepID=UPI00355C691C